LNFICQKTQITMSGKTDKAFSSPRYFESRLILFLEPVPVNPDAMMIEMTRHPDLYAGRPVMRTAWRMNHRCAGGY
jgi:hypothetical protein